MKQGITDPYFTAARIKQKMIENANKTVLVTDSSKFGVINTYFVCSIDEIGHIITDYSAPKEEIGFFDKQRHFRHVSIILPKKKRSCETSQLRLF